MYLTLLGPPTSWVPGLLLSKLRYLALAGDCLLSREHRSCQQGFGQQKIQPRCHLLRQLREQLSRLGGHCTEGSCWGGSLCPPPGADSQFVPIRSLYPPQVCLTDGAKDECNVVEVIGRNHKNQEITVPVANLKLSCQPLVRAPAGIWWRGRSSVACAKERVWHRAV